MIWMLLISVPGVFAATGSAALGPQVERRVTHAQAQPYYATPETKDVCEAWPSCAKWAAEEYRKDSSFKIVRAKFLTQRHTYRHQVIKETFLFVEATLSQRTVRV